MVRTGERLGGHRRLESARAALRGNPRHEPTAVRALPSEIGRGDDLRRAWYRVGGRFRQSMAASGSSGGLTSRVGDDLRRRRFPRPTWRKSCLSVQSGHVGTGADGSPAGGSGSGGLHSDDRRLRLNVYAISCADFGVRRRGSSSPGNKPTGKRMQERQPHRTPIGIAQRGDPFGDGIDLRNAPVREFQHDLPINSVRPRRRRWWGSWRAGTLILQSPHPA